MWERWVREMNNMGRMSEWVREFPKLGTIVWEKKGKVVWVMRREGRGTIKKVVMKCDQDQKKKMRHCWWVWNTRAAYLIRIWWNTDGTMDCAVAAPMTGCVESWCLRVWSNGRTNVSWPFLGILKSQINERHTPLDPIQLLSNHFTTSPTYLLCLPSVPIPTHTLSSWLRTSRRRLPVVTHEVEIYRLLAGYTKLPHSHIKTLLPLPIKEWELHQNKQITSRREGSQKTEGLVVSSRDWETIKDEDQNLMKECSKLYYCTGSI